MKKYFVLLAIGLLTSIQAFAAIQTITGTNFDLIYDDTKLGLFGAPSVAGNNIFFHP